MTAQDKVDNVVKNIDQTIKGKEIFLECLREDGLSDASKLLMARVVEMNIDELKRIRADLVKE